MAHTIEPPRTTIAADSRPNVMQVVALPKRDVVATPCASAGQWGASTSAQVFKLGFHFTKDDKAALALWIRDERHGYDRVEIDQGEPESGGRASYALVYKTGLAWSTWGVTRRDALVEVWCCATGIPLSRHERMVDALAALPHATEDRTTATLIGKDARRSKRSR